MDIQLVEVDKSNYEAVCDLDVTKEQEEYVACNMWSIVEATFNQGHVTRAINLNGEAVGFFMWVKETPTKVSIWRFMVDQNQQRKGIGRKALALALSEIKQDSELRQIEICYNPQNPVAKDFYSSFGFVEVGLDEDGEDMLAVIELAQLA